MSFCSNCGQEIGNVRFCPKCGTENLAYSGSAKHKTVGTPDYQKRSDNGGVSILQFISKELVQIILMAVGFLLFFLPGMYTAKFYVNEGYGRWTSNHLLDTSVSFITKTSNTNMLIGVITILLVCASIVLFIIRMRNVVTPHYSIMAIVFPGSVFFFLFFGTFEFWSSHHDVYSSYWAFEQAGLFSLEVILVAVVIILSVLELVQERRAVENRL